MHFLLKVPKILPIYYASRELVFKSIKEWLQPQDGDCSDVLILKRLPSASEPLLPPPSSVSCVNTLDTRLAHLMIKDVAVADVVMPDQVAADLGHPGDC